MYKAIAGHPVTVIAIALFCYTFFEFYLWIVLPFLFFFFQAEDGIRDWSVTGVQTCALPISAHRLLQLVEVELADLGHLGGDDGAAIALIRIAAVIVAVVLLRRVEHLESDDGGDDRVIPHLLGLELTDHLLHDRLLLRRVVEHGRTVLGADVRSLAVQSRGVVDGEEDVQQVAERYHRRVERDLYDLGVTGRSSAHVLVRWVGGVAARVSGLHPLDALQILERGFEAPEAATGERGGFELRHGHTSLWSSRKLTPVYRSTPNSSATMSVGAGTTMPRAFS